MTPFDLSAPPSVEAGPLLEAMRGLFGFVPNLGVAMAASPAALGGYLASLQALDGAEGLTPIERQLVMIAASRANEAAYGVAVHSTLALKLGASETLVAGAAGDQEGGADQRIAALLQFTTALTRDRGRVAAQELEAVLNAGYGSASLVEVAFAVALKHFANTVAHLAQPEIDPGFGAAAR